MKFETNWVPQSLMTSSGRPWSFQILSQNSWATPNEVTSDVVRMMLEVEKYSSTMWFSRVESCCIFPCLLYIYSSSECLVSPASLPPCTPPFLDDACPHRILL